MDQLIHFRDEPTAGVGGSPEHLTILPPPPEVTVPDPRAPLSGVPQLAEPDLLEMEELREPTDVDLTLWWDAEDDEDAAITERPPRFQQTH